MFDPCTMLEDGAVLLMECSDTARELGVSASEVRRLADEGRLKVYGRTVRGIRLFETADVAVLKAQRQAKRNAA
jgi:DNA-binding transcriptional MerR regulator